MLRSRCCSYSLNMLLLCVDWVPNTGPNTTRVRVSMPRECEALNGQRQKHEGSHSNSHHTSARGGQLRLLRPAVRSRVVDLRRAETPPDADPAEDVELATYCCGGVTPPASAHASQLRPCVGLRVVQAD
eukprot:scaffold21718_cov58-Phaeocystis_antarctica.AAC.4